jgi:hypothetical protein
MIARTLDEYLGQYGKLLQQQAQSALDPLYVPGRDSPANIQSLRNPFAKQHDAISGAVQALDQHRALILNGACGVGKTLCGQLVIHTHAGGTPYRAIIMCPGQLTEKSTLAEKGSGPTTARSIGGNLRGLSSANCGGSSAT